jgi:arabinan endo-1,5-alpha-L-arabinosidase
MTRRRLSALAAVSALAVVALAGCAGSSGGSGGAGSGGPGSDSPGAAADTDAFAIDQDFPDPDVLQTGDGYYAYATNGAGFNVQTARSDDLGSWDVLAADALPQLPAWALPGKTWAPDVSEFAPGQFVMYFTAANKSPQAQCIGAATSGSAEGPFVAAETGAIVCPGDEGGAIDASTFVDDDGTRYLVWKNDGNCCGLDTWLQIAPLSADGLALAGETTKLLVQTEDWEGDLIEAPTLVKRDGVYVLLYSANDYGGDSYATGYATAPSVVGPYTKADGPLLSTRSSDGRYLGPGGQDVVTAPDGSDRLVFHSWDSLYIQRGMNVVPLGWKDGVPTLG